MSTEPRTVPSAITAAATEQRITAEVIDRIAPSTDPRLRRIVTSLITHLHGFVRDVELTETEWFAAIQFLTRTGQKCSDERQEFILLSDVLGISMLVDAVNHRQPSGATETTVFGPFYTGEQPLLPHGASILKRPEPAPTLRVSGHVRAADGKPLAGALVEVWQVDANGLYDVQDAAIPKGHLRASFRTREDGGFAFLTIAPVTYAIPTDGPVGELLRGLGRHAMRPAHIHFMISAPGYERLVTHIFVAGDKYLQGDAVFGVKNSLVAAFDRDHVEFDFGLKPLAA
jgi:catechol 1,2-dioxygenase